jgi:hypothetical protein
MVLRWRLRAAKPKAKRLFCSFCGKSSDAVKALIAGPTVFICDECVAVCNNVLGGELPPAPEPRWNNYSEEQMLEMLPRASVIADHANEFLASHVDALRKRDVTWADIGKALGVSRQAAWERFS